MSNPKRPCPVCESTLKEVLYTQKFSQFTSQPQLKGYDVALCVSCGTAYADDIPNQGWFDDYYQRISKYTHDQRKGEESPIDSIRFKDIADLIVKQMPDREGGILDFGCATGGLLNRLKQIGYTDLLGMDQSRSSAEIAKERYEITVINSGLSDFIKAGRNFSLIIQVGVLEHICDVRAALDTMRRLMKPSGLIYIEVPDAVGFCEWKGAPFQQFSIEHINFFSTDSLSGLMARSGFETVEILRTVRDHTINTKMPVVCGFFRITDRPSIPSSDSQTGVALRKYIGQSTSAENRIKETIRALVDSREPILLWGVGTQTLHLMETTDLKKVNIVAFVDSNSNYQGQKLYDKPVLAPSDLKSRHDTIMISSQLFQTEINDQIRGALNLSNKVIQLHEA